MSTDDTRQTALWKRLVRRYLLPYVWYVHAPVVLLLYATPSECLQRMQTAARPSTQRLHLRNLFVEGRRYALEPLRHGFRLTTTSKVGWRYRKRTSATAIMRGTFSKFDDDITRIRLVTRINTGYLLDSFLLPGFMASLLVFMPWHPLVIAVLVVVILGLSWAGHRYNARMEANEMVWFVQKALEDFIPAQVMTLQDENPHVINANRDFEEAWERFYATMTSQDNETAGWEDNEGQYPPRSHTESREEEC